MGKKVRKVVAKFDLGHQAGKGFGLPDPSGDALYGSEKKLSPQEQQAKTAKAQAEVAAQQALIAQNAIDLASNNTSDNTVNAVVGGTADANDSSSSDNRRRRGGSVSSVLGI